MPASREETPWKQIALFLLTFSAVVACAFVLRPFLTAILGATVLAVITERPYDWLSSKIENSNLCAAIGLVLVILAVIIPSFFLVQDIGQQAVAAVDAMRDPANQQKFSELLGGHPAIASRVESVTNSIDLNHAIQTIGRYLGGKVAGLLGNSFRVITQIVVMLFLLFFFFRDREIVLSYLRSVLPLRDDEATDLLQKIGDTIYATALGRMVVAGVQGILAGLAFWALGVPGAVLWGFTTVAVAMIPAFGSFLVWVPIAVYLGLSGHWGKAALLAIWGGVVVSTIDNFLFPILVGTRLRSHTAAILLSILGGIATFGIPGIILGPVVFTIAATLLDFWHTRANPGPVVSTGS
jgi:predicted PurR-regulated permease PerM